MNNEDIVALYIRVSTTEQANDGFGLEAQRKRLYAYCEAKNYSIFKLYCDAGVSGKETTHRKEYNRMLADMKAGKFNKILALKLDRISRSVKDFALFLEMIRKYDCDLEFVDGNIDISGPGGKMIATILSAFAEFERDMIVDRTTAGMEEAAQSGHFGGKPPLGYRKEIINGEKGKKWIIDEEEAEVVKEIFNLCLKGKTYNDIAKIMQDKHSDIIAYTRKDKDTGDIINIPRSWTDASISVILNNRTYLGIREHRKNIKGKKIIEITGQIPRIISDEIFDECQEKIRRNKRNYYRSKRYLFMQKLICPKCGRVMACKGTKKKTGKEYLYYKCKDCKTNFREDLVEKALISELTLVLELYLILEKNYVPVDSETAKELKKGKLDNTLRYAIDTMVIDKKLDPNYTYLYQIWDMVSYETKCNFIHEYIDKIKLKKHTQNGKPYIEILDLTFAPHIVKVFKDQFNKNMMDTFINNSTEELSIAEFKSRKQADDYINILARRYNIKVYDEDSEDFGDNIFKIIKIVNNSYSEKNKTLYVDVLA